MHSQILGLIPARGGSKGVPRKNIRLVAGKPLIAYSIEAALQSRCLNPVIVSTDDEEIAQVSSSFGAEILMRPPELAGDETPMIAVVRHVIEQLEQQRRMQIDYCVLLQPTAPMRTAQDIQATVDILKNTGADSVVSVYKVGDHHPSRMYRIEDEKLIPLQSEPPSRLRQSLSPVYHRNGAVYAFQRNLLEQADTLIGADARPYIMPEERSVNIDNEIDLLMADLLLKR
jgi:CMP-N,N'-diacetyllegionaminic acid synthase